MGISFMQGIYIYISETNPVPREHRVAAILVLLFMVLISLVPALGPLYLYVSTFRSIIIIIIVVVVVVVGVVVLAVVVVVVVIAAAAVVVIVVVVVVVVLVLE
jgi:hypothetical protein